ncbi:BolA/IbaG family iron-sulfur metabolism protein [Marinomonas sp. 15G1-11]|uniref:BolA/IbaG family iron-sulfur metabolism protein n=1 Tax=Marinomonas phaeophyticola TaxID=3004091 RepID=A0ABT4JUZ7_9GAMM|nr:BolA/IbaG family iron-sulfur metabolism protein [Marinomonas sp. 15G1-11]MCZ2722197.1 BolA/IbaG family iron-sulfur metabolism protein [Marinomonas sp. 15G1-11]
MTANTIKNEILTALNNALNYDSIALDNESYKHNVPEGSESHFKLLLVSEIFEGKRLVQRHQLIYKALSDVMPKFHALAMHLHTPEEWALKKETVPDSPNCHGGE